MYTKSGKVNNVEELISKHSITVKKIAYQLKSRLPACVELDDLIQTGMMGLMDAIHKYEDGHGAQFETYASQRIRGSMIDELRNADYLPRTLRKSMRDIETAMSKVEQTVGRAANDGEIAAELGISIDEYQDMLTNCNGHQLVYYEDFYHTKEDSDHFLDHYVNDVDGDPIKILLSSGFKDMLTESIDQLPEREKTIMGLYYEQEMNFKEIGAVLDLCESRVCQLHTQSIGRLRTIMKGETWNGVV